MTAWSPWDIAERAAGALGPESSLVADQDVAQFGAALGRAAVGAGTNPVALAAAGARLAADLARIPPAALGRLLGVPVDPPLPVNPKDRRFADQAWSDNPAFFALRQGYLALSRLSRDLVGAAGLPAGVDGKARLAVDLLLDAAAPTNFLPTNPAALKRAFDTGGLSVLRGARHFVDDLLHNNGRPRQVDTSPFTLGGNLAATPAKVVYRNDLMELLQYAPQTERVHATPLLCSPPWINKYYVMDLAPGRSFVEWAVRHDRTVFAISYRNPSAEMSGVTMDDYLVHGPKQALDVIEDITGANTIDIVGLCLGGALTAITDAYLTGIGDSRVGSLTLLNTLLDYTEPGALKLFTDAGTVDRLEKQMRRTGHLDGRSMAGTFDVMRANDLIFNYVVSNWLMGQDPPAFDILAWNADSTRMPAAMHAFYLRNFYVENRLASGTLEIAGQRIDLSDIKKNAYVVSAENDHIVPWQSAYATTRLLSGPVRFVLSSGGHIAGIVNPPGPKGWYLTGEELPETPAAWRAGTTRHAGSWWEDWTEWSSGHAGDLMEPPPTGSADHPVLGDGPGDYIRT
jgi:polyhydroxyalkanoate synthase subunit PhaC